MNYLAHAWGRLDDPYVVAGVAVPDWLGLTRPRLRCRSRHALPFIDSDDPVLASIAGGVGRHHADDDWFHQTAAFGELSLELARRIRQATGDADGMRPSFLGHILVELLLDATLAEREPARLDRYYAALEEVDPSRVAAAVARMTGSEASQLATIVERFVSVRFLYDYADDQRLTFRLNQVMRRVGLSELPPAFTSILPAARVLVSRHCDALLTHPMRRTGDAASPLASLASLAS